MGINTDFIVVLPKTIITIPQDSNLAWLTLFYALPQELVAKRFAYLDLPRNVTQLLNDEHAKKLLKDEAFLELVWDCYARSAWQFFQIPHKDGTYHDIPGDWKNYSRDFPLWRMSYDIIRYFRDKFEHEMEWSFQRLFMMPPDVEIPWLDYQQFSNLVGNLTDMVVAEQNWQPIIDEVWRSRDPVDYNDSSSHERSWLLFVACQGDRFLVCQDIGPFFAVLDIGIVRRVNDRLWDYNLSCFSKLACHAISLLLAIFLIIYTKG